LRVTAAFTLMHPRRIRFGVGCFEEVGQEAAVLGRRALIMCGRSAMRTTGILRRLVEHLSLAGVGEVVFDRVEPDPSRETVEEARALGRREACDFIIGLGGGSSLDAAKATAMMMTHDGSVAEYHSKLRAFERPGLPVLAIPTTAGSGAEATRNAVISDREKGIKESLRGPGMGATVALVDPELTVSMSPRLTADTGMDALTQAIECYLSTAAHPISDVLSLRAMSLIYANLERAYQEGHDVRNRVPVMLGSLMAGMAFADAGLGAVHGLSHPLGARLNLSHGFVCAVTLPYVLEFNYDVCKERFADMARALNLRQGSEVISAVRALNRILGIPDNLRAYGFTEDMIPVVVAECRSNSMSKNPRPASDEDIVRIVRHLL